MAAFERAIGAAYLDVHRSHIDAMPLCILDKLGWPVESHWLAIQQGGEKCGRFVTFDPGLYCRAAISRLRSLSRLPKRIGMKKDPAEFMCTKTAMSRNLPSSTSASP